VKEKKEREKVTFWAYFSLPIKFMDDQRGRLAVVVHKLKDRKWDTSEQKLKTSVHKINPRFGSPSFRLDGTND
jgi:hypothetical protein